MLDNKWPSFLCYVCKPLSHYYSHTLLPTQTDPLFFFSCTVTAADDFASHLAELEEQDEQPIYTDADGITYAYSRHDSLILLSTTRHNANMTMALVFHVHVCRV